MGRIKEGLGWGVDADNGQGGRINKRGKRERKVKWSRMMVVGLFLLILQPRSPCSIRNNLGFHYYAC